MEATVPATAPGFLRLKGMTPAALGDLLDLACRMRQSELHMFHSLRGGTVVCMFEEPSARVHVSFEAAAYRLGLLPIVLQPEELRLGRDEWIEDTARTLSACCEAIVARVPDHSTLEVLAAAASVPVINAGSHEHDPCQAIADILTIRDRFGDLSGVRLAYVGEPTNVANSLVEAGAIAGMDVVVAVPDSEFEVSEVVEQARLEAQQHGGRITVVSDPREAAQGADAISTGAEMATVDDVHGARDPALFRVTRDLMCLARPNAIFLHCLPANRRREVEARVIDGSQSVVWEQDANRVCTEQAILRTVLRRAREAH